MAVTMADITKLRKMTGAGMMDCKNALTQANNDFDEAVKIIREKGKAVAAKRSDRDASEGCVLVKVDGNFGAMIALKCETDFVANNADFVKLTQDILDAAVANRCKTLDEVKALKLGDRTVAEAVTDRSGITGEKMELDGYNVLEGEGISTYNHMNKNFLCTMCLLNKSGFEEAGHEVALQIAAVRDHDSPLDPAENRRLLVVGIVGVGGIPEDGEHLPQQIPVRQHELSVRGVDGVGDVHHLLRDGLGLVQAAFYEEITNPSMPAPGAGAAGTETVACPNCGAPVEKGNSFCPQCGKVQFYARIPETDKQKGNQL